MWPLLAADAYFSPVWPHFITFRTCHPRVGRNEVVTAPVHLKVCPRVTPDSFGLESPRWTPVEKVRLVQHSDSGKTYSPRLFILWPGVYFWKSRRFSSGLDLTAPREFYGHVVVLSQNFIAIERYGGLIVFIRVCNISPY